MKVIEQEGVEVWGGMVGGVDKGLRGGKVWRCFAVSEGV